jgi:Tfp pilus assembly protein PilF
MEDTMARFKNLILTIFLLLLMFNVASYAQEKETTQASQNFQQGLNYYMSGDYQNALQYLTAAIQSDKTLLDAYYYRARVYMEYYKDYDKAIADFNTIVKTDNTDFESYYLMGACYYNKGDGKNAQANYNNAINAFVKSLNLTPDQSSTDITSQVKMLLPYYDVLSIYYMDLLLSSPL